MRHSFDFISIIIFIKNLNFGLIRHDISFFFTLIFLAFSFLYRIKVYKVLSRKKILFLKKNTEINLKVKLKNYKNYKYGDIK